MFSLRTKLIFLMVFLYLLVVISLFVIGQISQHALNKEINDNIEDLTKAIQFSVQNLTSEGVDSQSQIEQIVKKFRKKGVSEISILSEDKEIIASSNPKKVGTTVDKKSGTNFLIKAELGTKAPDEKLKEINIPIIIGDEKYGYVDVIFHMDTFTNLQQKHSYMRMITTLIIFTIGTLLIILLASQYVRPINKIVDATVKVSSGQLVPIDKSKLSLSPEIEILVENFNDMVTKLKERIEIEKKLEEMEHMYKVGQLSSAIAHEIKNPLNFINLTVNQVKDEIMDTYHNKPLANLLMMVEDEIKRINDLLVNFLEYGKPLKLNFKMVNVEELLENLKNIISIKLLDRNISLKIETDSNIIMKCDYDKMLGCFINLVINAVESIEKNGEIRINAFKSGDMVVFHVIDNGKGVPDNIKTKLFDPYISTKSTGMGLGLSFTKRIIEEHRGRIYLNEDYKDGADFVIEVPIEA
jgi:signal transduction histidine kinase